jgi:hypothetical protein
MRIVTRLIAAAVPVLFAASCGTMANVNEMGRKVTIIDAPYPGCVFVVSGHGNGPDDQNALNNLQNMVGEKGATHLVLTGGTELAGQKIVPLPLRDNGTSVHGFAYRCPDKQAAPKQAPAKAAGR